MPATTTVIARSSADGPLCRYVCLGWWTPSSWKGSSASTGSPCPGVQIWCSWALTGPTVSVTAITPEQREYAQTIPTSGENLLTIINDILDFSKIEVGKMELEEMDFDLQRVVEETVDLLAERAHNKGLELASLIGPLCTELEEIGRSEDLRAPLARISRLEEEFGRVRAVFEEELSEN